MEYLNVSSLEKRMALKICQLCAVDFTLKHFLTPLIDGMQQKRWVVTSICSDSGFVEELKTKGYKINVINISRSFNLFKHFKTFVELVLFFRKEKFDILHVHTPIAALIGRFAAKFSGIDFVVYTAHGFYFHDEMPNWKKNIYIFLEKLGGNCTDLLLTQSKEDEVSAKKNKILASEKIFSIGNGVNIIKFDPKNIKNKLKTKNEYKISRDCFVIGIIGRLVKEKGYIEFLDAAIRLYKKYKKICFLVIGERIKSDHNTSVESYLINAQKILGDHLVRISYSDDMPSLINIMDVFCLPSHREGMPRSIIEAMMMGKPVIATNIRGSREEVINNITGLLVPVNNAKELYKAFETLILNKKFTLKLGKNGRTRAIEHFSEIKIVEKQLYLIKKFYRLKKIYEKSI